MSAGVDASFLEEERRILLPRLIPPLVHRLNNSLAVLHGLSEFGRRTAPSDLLDREFESARSLLVRLSSFTKSPPATIDVFDLRAVVEGIRDLLKPLAETSGVRFEVALPRGGTILRADRDRLEQLVATLVGQELLAVAAEHGGIDGSPDQAPLVRITARRDRTRTILSIVRPRSITRGDGPTALLQKAAEWAERHGTTLSMRSLGEVTCYRFAFASLGDDLPEEEEVTIRHGRRLLLFESDRPLGELIKTICTEAGYEVKEEAFVDPSLLDASGVDLVLLDSDLELGRPGSLARLAAVAELSGRMLLLGEPPVDAGLDALPFLEKPFRPDDLLDAISRLVTSSAAPEKAAR